MAATDPLANQQVDEATFRKHLAEMVNMYNEVAERCFLACAHDFTTRNVSNKEESCSMNCLEKYLKVTQRLSQRFQESHLIQNEAAIAAQQQKSSTLSK